MPPQWRDNKTGFRVLLLPDAKLDESLLLSSAREATEAARKEADGTKTLFPDEWQYAEAIRKQAQKADDSSSPALYREAERLYKKLARDFRKAHTSNK